jgi:hypothetical protein
MSGIDLSPRIAVLVHAACERLTVHLSRALRSAHAEDVSEHFVNMGRPDTIEDGNLHAEWHSDSRCLSIADRPLVLTLPLTNVVISASEQCLSFPPDKQTAGLEISLDQGAPWTVVNEAVGTKETSGR